MPHTNEGSVLGEVSAELLSDHGAQGTSPIRREDVRRWMLTEDAEAQGALFSLLMDPSHFSRITPSLELADYHSFVMRYLERCLKENPDGEWSDSRYSAGWSLVNWFRGLWTDSTVPRHVTAELKDWIASMYRDGNEVVRTCLVNATLEHLFEEADIARYFSDWQRDPTLQEAYAHAMEWRSKGRSS